ncbi:hypothetical protein BDP55DRAFT_665573 [Colletotrichum godetiae]|uniref:Secreted protein n=1 Tax=Colletotrichum godetiae TaxID=1209918 RepID=A0AAJ0AMA5_9PEZI|nr:uncharacterized protein BDP55DRAFT_665573 [Colletotrichum godetiae]KAK1675002.1 hypothetical protein BDP55DRAFT_665573 [Colletotrichum godetiae]
MWAVLAVGRPLIFCFLPTLLPQSRQKINPSTSAVYKRSNSKLTPRGTTAKVPIFPQLSVGGLRLEFEWLRYVDDNIDLQVSIVDGSTKC